MFGLLNLRKPPGITSRDVVNVVQRLVRPAKTGHAGTLDPLAEGVLLVCVGQATRLTDYLHRLPKGYRASFRLGCRSDTEDVSGSVVDLDHAPQPTRPEVEAVLGRFVGRIEQMPPAYSAKRLQGRRAYKLARAGKQPRLTASTVTIFGIELLAYDYPQLDLDVTCGSGTYIRSLGRDIGRELGSDAVMAALTRTRIGDFQLDASIDPQVLNRDNVGDFLIPAVRAVTGLPEVHVDRAEETRIAQGKTVERAGLPPAPEYAAITADGRLAAILAPRDGSALGPTRYFPPSVA